MNSRPEFHILTPPDTHYNFIKLYKMKVGEDGAEHRVYDPEASQENALNELAKTFRPLSGSILNLVVISNER
jgi:hypothetical protein